jgi:hypothetical protein
MHATTLEDPDVCKNFSIPNDRAIDNFLCTRSDYGKMNKFFLLSLDFNFYSQIADNDTQQHYFNDVFLINEHAGRWFLRGLKLQDISQTSFDNKVLAAFSDLSLHLRWIADNSKKIYAMPKIPNSKKAFGQSILNLN